MDTAFLTSGLEEPCVYISGDVHKLINAVVFRGKDNRDNLNMRRAGSQEGGNLYDIEIYVSKTDVPAVRINKDSVQVTKVIGDIAATIMNVVKIIRMDQGGFRLGLM